MSSFIILLAYASTITFFKSPHAASQLLMPIFSLLHFPSHTLLPSALPPLPTTCTNPPCLHDTGCRGCLLVVPTQHWTRVRKGRKVFGCSQNRKDGFGEYMTKQQGSTLILVIKKQIFFNSHNV